jgi:hypothetical protein
MDVKRCSPRHQGRNSARTFDRKTVNGRGSVLVGNALYHRGDLAGWQRKLLWRPSPKLAGNVCLMVFVYDTS